MKNLLVIITITFFSSFAEAQQAVWTKLNTEPYPGKQDDISFINENQGWYVNGLGSIYKTLNGGQTWEKLVEMKGSFFRTIAFLNEQVGFVGTVGTDYFPNVTDTIPLYGTSDGGKTWNPVPYSGPYVKGLCAMDIVREQFINHGQIDFKTHIYAVGRVGSPANLMVSHDAGKTWTSRAMDSDAQMLFDIKMFDKNTGIACAASDADITKSNALILRTEDGGETWFKVYQSNRPFETTWKVSFPTADVGYVTIQSYNPDPIIKQQRIAKSTDGGRTWKELNLVEDSGAREFGVGFLNENHGFVGTVNSGFETLDGGLTWTPVDLGRACNKIRIYEGNERQFGFAIGVDVLKLEWR
ncbi:WD40/YVTN/BNR-like repeat-containing protein [Algoriphagus sp.]|uniref:WD40/YVTN/BNR-like repeat-containing protein n=1 Tax=Algoriphagus sp. TaxID=1872435 RepID=UPI00391A4F98